MPFDAVMTPRSRALPLSESEKAALFDLALAAAGASDEKVSAAREHASLIAAFAQAYILIRDREEGLV